MGSNEKHVGHLRDNPCQQYAINLVRYLNSPYAVEDHFERSKKSILNWLRHLKYRVASDKNTAQIEKGMREIRKIKWHHVSTTVSKN